MALIARPAATSIREMIFTEVLLRAVPTPVVDRDGNEYVQP
jgi:hypothetical protein